MQAERQRQRQRVMLGLAAGLVVAIVLAAFAFIQRQDAVVQRQEAVLQRQEVITQHEISMCQAAIVLAGQSTESLPRLSVPSSAFRRVLAVGTFSAISCNLAITIRFWVSAEVCLA